MGSSLPGVSVLMMDVSLEEQWSGEKLESASGLPSGETLNMSG